MSPSHAYGRPPPRSLSPPILQALDVDPATGLLEGDDDEEGFEEEYPLEQLNIATAGFMAKVGVVHYCTALVDLGSSSSRFPPADGPHGFFRVGTRACVGYPPHHASRTHAKRPFVPVSSSFHVIVAMMAVVLVVVMVIR